MSIFAGKIATSFLILANPLYIGSYVGLYVLETEDGDRRGTVSDISRTLLATKKNGTFNSKDYCSC